MIVELSEISSRKFSKSSRSSNSCSRVSLVIKTVRLLATTGVDDEEVKVKDRVDGDEEDRVDDEEDEDRINDDGDAFATSVSLSLEDSSRSEKSSILTTTFDLLNLTSLIFT